jgi:3-deoxy-D-manno-octulosonic acid (KDO) 8-phosphate synthase
MPEGRERRLQPFGQAGRAIVVAHVIKDIGHCKVPLRRLLHPAPSDGPNMVPLKEMEGLLRRLIAFDRLAKDTIR